MERHTGIQDLPVEVLLYIFRLSFNITSLQQDRRCISLVCKNWRDVVQESASLWTEISAHDAFHYSEKSLAKSGGLLIDIYFLCSGSPRPPTSLSVFLHKLVPRLPQCRSISLITQTFEPEPFRTLFAELGERPSPCLDTLILKAGPSHRGSVLAGPNPPQLPDTSAFPMLRRLEIDGMPCKLSSQRLQLHGVLSLNLVDVMDVSAEQLLEVLRNSPYLETLELGRSPIVCPAHTTSTPIHLLHLTTLHLISMPIPVSNFFLSTLHTPNCCELFISSQFPPFPDDVVKGRLFTTSTNHFTPVLRTLLARGQYKYIAIDSSAAQSMEFSLNFHDGKLGHPACRQILGLEFSLHSVNQIEETVRWLGDYLQQDIPKISIRLQMAGFEDVRTMNLLDSHTTISVLFLEPPSNSDAPIHDSILVHMGHPTHSGWPLPDLEVFGYGIQSQASQDAMLDMLRRRYGSSSEESDSEAIRPRPIKAVRIPDCGRSAYLLGEVRKILPHAEIFVAR